MDRLFPLQYAEDILNCGHAHVIVGFLCLRAGMGRQDNVFTFENGSAGREGLHLKGVQGRAGQLPAEQSLRQCVQVHQRAAGRG